MTRNEFEASFNNFDMAQVRYAHLMKALADGPQGPLVGLQPSFYNEIYFLACYSLLKRHPTRKGAILMAFHCMPRTGAQPGNPGAIGMNPWEMLVDPVNRGSEAHRNVAALNATVIQDYLTKHPVQDGQGDRPMMISQDRKGETLIAMFRPMVSQLWLYGGPMRAYLAAVGNLTHDQLVAQANQNRELAMQDEVKAKWLSDRIGRAMGTTHLSERYGVTFDANQVGLQGPSQRWVRGRTPIVIGNRR